MATQRQIGAPITVSHVQVISVAFSPDGRLLATVGVGCRTRLWKVATRRQVGAAMSSGGSSNRLQAVTFSPDGKILATLSAGVQLWNAATQRPIGSPIYDGVIHGLAFSPNSKILATTGSLTLLWNVATQRRIGMLPGVRNAYWVAFSPSGQILITVDNATIRQWSVATNRQIRRPIALRHRPWGLLDAVLNPDGTIVATTQFYGPALFWSLAGGH